MYRAEVTAELALAHVIGFYSTRVDEIIPRMAPVRTGYLVRYPIYIALLVTGNAPFDMLHREKIVLLSNRATRLARL